MRIAHVAPRGVHPHSGLLTAMVHIAVGLAGRGVDVEVWQLSTWPDSDNRELIDALDDAGVRRVPIRGGAARLLARPSAVGGVRERAVDLVHLHGVFSPTNNALARRVEVPFVVSPHGGYAPRSLAFHRFRKTAFKHAFERPMLRRASLVCALTEIEAREIRAFDGPTPIVVIPNGADAPESDLARDAFRAEVGIDGGAPLAVYVGRLDVRAKRLDAIVRAAAAADGWHLAVIGGDYRDGAAEIRALITDLGAGDRIHLPGPRRGARLYEALAAADVFVLMSRSEGLPMALLEALAAGTPAVVSREVEGRIGVAAAGAGWVVDPERLEAVLRWLADSQPHEWETRSAMARVLASEYDWAQIAARYEAVYRDVLSMTPLAEV